MSRLTQGLALCLLVITLNAGSATATSEDDALQALANSFMSSFGAFDSSQDVQTTFTNYLSGMEDSMLTQGVEMWKNLMSSSTDLLKNSTGLLFDPTAGNYLADLAQRVEDFFCDGDYIIRGGVMPTLMMGPEMNITLNAGMCEVVYSNDYEDRDLVCQGPGVTYSRTPPTFTYKHFKMDQLVGKECALGRRFGTSSSAILCDPGQDYRFSSLSELMQAVTNGFFTSWTLPTGNLSQITAPGPTGYLPMGWTIVQAS